MSSEDSMDTAEKIWSVEGFLDHVNEILSGDKASIVGEVSELRKHPTGFYFSLKDNEGGNGILQCYLSPWKARMLGIDFEEGFLIKARGTPSIYKPRGSFSFVVEEVELVGEGSLKKAYELLKSKLEQEGLFARKRELPQFITSIGVITSKTGAVIDDFRKNLKKLGFQVSLYDSRVEGAQAVPMIVRGIDHFNAASVNSVDILVIIRGGGSLEDLQAFNNELVARKIFSSRIPVLCGIGHDRDVPIASLVCDKAVSTPSMAAETVNASWDGLFLDLPVAAHRLVSLFEAVIVRETNVVEMLAGPLADRFASVAEGVREKLENISAYLRAADPMRNLKLGYSVVFDAAGKVVKDARFLKKGDTMKTKLYRGSVESEVSKISGE